ncbi:hypothetical protein HN924_02745 [Candidatus Woesearchaeota archaeon]|jgi:hypothetical protein|nr:hypothetical protein [Candidatus Woesearchaeota archaeon]MBT7062860.1 hypothetical protein [Candidatus Woesearchaeota archaeon]MBT7403025.1 hypothetical protein [Candidatus Woesearchaeota archaeon]
MTKYTIYDNLEKDVDNFTTSKENMIERKLHKIYNKFDKLFDDISEEEWELYWEECEKVKAELGQIKDVYTIDELVELRKHPNVMKGISKIRVEGVPYSVTGFVTTKDSLEKDSDEHPDDFERYELRLGLMLGDVYCHSESVRTSADAFTKALTELKSAEKLEKKIQLGVRLSKHSSDIEIVEIVTNSDTERRGYL